MSSEVGSRIAKNSIYNVLRVLLSIPVVLLVTPYIIRTIGREEFGIWALVGVITSYASLSDFGVTECLVKYFAESHATNDTEEINALINTALAIFLASGLVCGILFVLLLPFAVDIIFNIPASLRAKSLSLFTVTLVLFLINMMMGVFGSLINGFQRMGYTNLIGLSSTLLTAGGTVFFLHNGYGLWGLVYCSIMTTIFVSIANLWGAMRLFPALQIRPLHFVRRAQVKKIFGFSWKVFVSGVTGLMIFQMDRVLISHFLGLSAVTSYEIANRITYQARGLMVSVFSPMTPAASVLQAHNNRDKIIGLYRRSFKYMAMVAIPLSGLLIAFAHPFVRTWMGDGYEVSAYTIQLLSLANLMNLFTAPGHFILNGINMPHIGMRSSIVGGVTNICLCLLFVMVFGYYGVVTAIFLSFLSSGVYFIVMIHRNVPGLPVNIYANSLLRPVTISFILCLLGLLLDKELHLRGYHELLMAGVLFMVMVAVTMWQGDFLDEFDRETILRLCPGFVRSALTVRR